MRMRLMMRDKRRNDAQPRFNQMEGFDTADDGIGIGASVERCKLAAVSAAYPNRMYLLSVGTTVSDSV